MPPQALDCHLLHGRDLFLDRGGSRYGYEKPPWTGNHPACHPAAPAFLALGRPAERCWAIRPGFQRAIRGRKAQQNKGALFFSTVDDLFPAEISTSALCDTNIQNATPSELCKPVQLEVLVRYDLKKREIARRRASRLQSDLNSSFVHTERPFCPLCIVT